MLNSPCHTRTSSLEEAHSSTLILSSSSSSDDDATLFSTPRNSFNSLGPTHYSPPRRSPPHHWPPHPIGNPADHKKQISHKSKFAAPPTTANSTTMISPLSQPMARNNSSGSLASSSATMFQARMNNKNGAAGSIPNGINQATFPMGKRSYALMNGGGGPPPSFQQHFPLLQQQQQQGTGRTLFYTAALNNLQQQQAGEQQASSAKGSNNNFNIGPRLAMCGATACAVAMPPSSIVQESCAESVAGESSIGAATGVAGGSNSPKSTKSKRKKSRGGLSSSQHHQLEPLKKHRGELSINEKYRYDLSRAQLKASSRTSALLSGFAMIALVELQYMPDTPKHLLIMLGVVTTLLVSVHLLALMMSTCLLPYIEANGCTQDSPHIKLKFYIELSWIFSTCIGLVLFLLEIGVIFFVKFNAIGYNFAAYITTGMLIPVLIIFVVISYLIHRNRLHHSLERVNDKVVDLQKYLAEAEVNNQSSSIHRNMVGVGLQGVTVVRNSGGNFKE